jgi:hypothetical protein
MKNRHCAFHNLLVGTTGLASLLCASLLQAGDPAAASTADAVTIPQSLFVMPGPGLNLRDPFYPNSSRFETKVQPVIVPEVPSAELTLKGISGTPERPLAMIESATFEVGEERLLRTAQGTRVKVRLIAVDVEGLKVTIGLGDETRELRLRSQEPDKAPASTPSTAETPETVRLESSGGF